MNFSETTRIFKCRMGGNNMEEKELPERPTETPEIPGIVLARGPLE
jgi:hypothetical protein